MKTFAYEEPHPTYIHNKIRLVSLQMHTWDRGLGGSCSVFSKHFNIWKRIWEWKWNAPAIVHQVCHIYFFFNGSPFSWFSIQQIDWKNFAEIISVSMNADLIDGQRSKKLHPNSVIESFETFKTWTNCKIS